MKRFRVVPLLIAITGLGALAPVAKGESAADTGYSSSNVVSPSPSTTYPPLNLTHGRPTEKTKLRNYFFDGFGPYAIADAFVGGNVAREFLYGAPHALFSHMDRSASRGTDAIAHSNP